MLQTKSKIPIHVLGKQLGGTCSRFTKWINTNRYILLQQPKSRPLILSGVHPVAGDDESVHSLSPVHTSYPFTSHCAGPVGPPDNGISWHPDGSPGKSNTHASRGQLISASGSVLKHGQLKLGSSTFVVQGSIGSGVGSKYTLALYGCILLWMV